ncbi:hypothetical protein D3C72_1888060 [compost metagenome]
MAAHRHGAERHRLADQCLGTLEHRRGSGQFTLFDGQAFTQAADRLMRVPAVADKALVQMDVTVNQTGQHQVSCQVDDLGACAGRTFAAQADNAPVGNREVEQAAIGSNSVDEYTIDHFTALCLLLIHTL